MPRDRRACRAAPGLRGHARGHIARRAGRRACRAVAPTTTGADGVFRLGPASPGEGDARPRAAAAAIRARCRVKVAAGCPRSCCKVKPGASIAGRVIDGEGKPVGGVAVMATSAGPTRVDDDRQRHGDERRAGADQRRTARTFELRSSAGTYVLRVLDRGTPAAAARQADRGHASARPTRRPASTIAIDRPNGVIKGVVTGPDGKPLADAWVSVHQDLEAMHRGRDGRARRRPRRRRDVADGHRAVRRRRRQRRRPQAFAPALTDAQGRFESANLPHAKYEVIAEAQAGKLRGRAPTSRPTRPSRSRSPASPRSRAPCTARTALRGAVLGRARRPDRAPHVRSPTENSSSAGSTRAPTRVRVSGGDGNAEVKADVGPASPPPSTSRSPRTRSSSASSSIRRASPLADVGVTLIPDSGDGRVELSLEGPPPTSGPDGSSGSRPRPASQSSWR